jgi:quinol monooxygenase YgiN
MILITVKWQVKPEHADEWPTITRSFTEATRAEPGNRWFQWSRSLDDPNEYVLIEAFADDGAAAHVNSDHFRQAQADLPKYLSKTPDIINTTVEQDTWSELGELRVEG